jgi:sporulation protein YlmC with PRC-barrel domain
MQFLKMLGVGFIGWSVALGGMSVAVAQVSEPAPAQSGVKTDAKTMTVFRSSDLTGMTVKNASGQNLGSVDDLVIDVTTGKVRYAAVSFGGFLGVGDKLFAVPFQAFQLKHDPGDNKRHLVLNVDKQKLERAKGFDKKAWPDFGDPRWGDENDQHFIDSTAAKPATERK